MKFAKFALAVDYCLNLVDPVISKMAKRFPGFHWFPLVSKFPETQKIQKPRNQLLFRLFDYLFNHRWTLFISFDKIGHGLPSFPVSWFLLVSKGCPDWETRGNWLGYTKVLMHSHGGRNYQNFIKLHRCGPCTKITLDMAEMQMFLQIF